MEHPSKQRIRRGSVINQGIHHFRADTNYCRCLRQRKKGTHKEEGRTWTYSSAPNRDRIFIVEKIVCQQK